ncbi:MAG: hypothetical protein JOZ42_00980 [Acetobacteraceae bacterium]|nr:hypothetical protein [Acetobacteraceae bacterium]
MAVAYAARYLAHPALPGNEYKLGWWGWFDQSKFLQSAQAFARLDFHPAQHWYPLGYSLLGAPFALRLGSHPFFFIDLAALLLALAGFVAVAQLEGFAPLWGVLIFVLATCGDGFAFNQWVIPWNTTPVAACLWLLLAVSAVILDGSFRRTVPARFALGLLAGITPLFRPTEAVLVLPCLAAVLIHDLRLGRFAWRNWTVTAGAGLLPVLFYAAIYLRIYGPHPTDYMLNSRDIGFTLHDLGWKAYVILVDPQPWFLDGTGLLKRMPWIALAFAGLMPALLRGRLSALLAIMLILHAVLYLSYVDMLPTGLWRYNNVHYWSWAFPAYGLLAAALLRDLVRPVTAARRIVAGASLAVTVLLGCVHLDPVPADEGAPAKMLTFSGGDPGFEQTYFAPLALRDASGELDNIRDMRAFPVPFGMRLIALRRDVRGETNWVADHAPPGPIAQVPGHRWAVGVRLGRPCWVPRMRCARTINDQLPPVPGL